MNWKNIDPDGQAAYEQVYPPFERGYVLAYELLGYLAAKGESVEKAHELVYAYFWDCVHGKLENAQMPFVEWYADGSSD